MIYNIKNNNDKFLVNIYIYIYEMFEMSRTVRCMSNLGPFCTVSSSLLFGYIQKKLLTFTQEENSKGSLCVCNNNHDFI